MELIDRDAVLALAREYHPGVPEEEIRRIARAAIRAAEAALFGETRREAGAGMEQGGGPVAVGAGVRGR